MILSTADVDKGFRLPRASSPTRVLSAPQPQTHSDAATTVMLSWPQPQQSAARTPQRLRRHRVPLPQQHARMTPQRRTRLEVQDQPSRTLSRNRHDVRNLSAGLESDGWRRV